MKTQPAGFSRTPFAKAFLPDAFSLPEMMCSLAIFCLAMGGVILSHLYGLRMWQVTSPKLCASDDARTAVSRLINDIRSCQIIRIGNGNLSSFTEVPMDTLQKGSAIRVYPTLDTNYYVQYYWDTSDQKLKYTTNGSSAVVVLASAVSNSLVFTAEDALGNILTNNYNDRIIGLMLEFYQIEYPRMSVGPGNYYDYYRLRTRITRRKIL
jgi:prepilin-type N-terminal cleavage/methylation domain-containing protein